MEARTSRWLALGAIFAAVAFAAPAHAAESPWTLGVVSSISALGIGGLAAILGLWIGRDPSRPMGFAVAMTALIVSAVSVGMIQSYLDEVEMMQKQRDLDQMMVMVSEIALATGDEELAAIIEAQGGAALDLKVSTPLPKPPLPHKGE